MDQIYNSTPSTYIFHTHMIYSSFYIFQSYYLYTSDMCTPTIPHLTHPLLKLTIEDKC